MNSNLRKEVGKKLKEVREKRRLTQVEVAIKAEITDSYYARIERGEENPTLEVLYNIIKALKIKSLDILPF